MWGQRNPSEVRAVFAAVSMGLHCRLLSCMTSSRCERGGLELRYVDSPLETLLLFLAVMVTARGQGRKGCRRRAWGQDVASAVPKMLRACVRGGTFTGTPDAGPGKCQTTSCCDSLRWR